MWQYAYLSLDMHAYLSLDMHACRAVTLESKMDYEASHAATYISLSTTYSQLGRHQDALGSAKLAVDMLCAQV
jgi:hypothetical protein